MSANRLDLKAAHSTDEVQGISSSLPNEQPKSRSRRNTMSDGERERILVEQSLQSAADPDEFDPSALPPAPASTVLGSFFNMSNAIVGAGLIGLPFAFKEAGLFSGAILLLLLAYVTDWTLRLLAYATKLSGRNSYQELVCFCFGRVGFHAISIFQFIFAFGGMCAFNVIIGDTFPHVVRSLFPAIANSPVLMTLTSRQAFIIFITLFISFPLSLYRDMSKLAKTSALALLAMSVIVIAVVIEAPKVTPDQRGSSEGKWDFIRPDIFQAIGVMSFAFVCHHNSFMIFSSLKKPTLNRYSRVIHLSTTLSAAVCLLLASVGYLNFTDKTRGNILNNFPDNNLLINIARFCFGFNMITTFPMETFVAREVVEGYVAYYGNHGPKDSTKAGEGGVYYPLDTVVHAEHHMTDLHLNDTPTTDASYSSTSTVNAHESQGDWAAHDTVGSPVAPFSLVRHVVVTAVMTLVTLVIALSVCDLGIVIELTGGISATALAFILPAGCHLKLSSGPRFTWSKLPLWALVVFGMCVLVLSPALTITRYMNLDPSEKQVC
ncbi:hypothetical protein IWQ62_001048 [Dispira parvispora]|uniref:Amino acid transporter transmembrane domain-containing protein n=1 Tax=Dispira parvispora TaxID=1520584 RepID=A0A9W8E5E1_9FUNG|nr:hypothetical protein IWQ62_001048 [Dispira parvispora]